MGKLDEVGAMRFYSVGVSSLLGNLELAWPDSVLPGYRRKDAVLRDPTTHEVLVTEGQAIVLKGSWGEDDKFIACSVGAVHASPAPS